VKASFKIGAKEVKKKAAPKKKAAAAPKKGKKKYLQRACSI
jgi:hypothetical protein